jgi:hypothetical protein
MQANHRTAVPAAWLLGRFRAPVSAVAAPAPAPGLVELPLAMALALIVMTMVMAGGLVTAIRSGVPMAVADDPWFDEPAVLAGGSLLAIPDRLDFEQPAGARTPSRNVEVTNLGSRPVDPLEVSALDPAGNRSNAYKVDTTGCAGGIPAKGTCVVRVEFVPRAQGDHRATLTIEAGDFSPLAILLRASAT